MHLDQAVPISGARAQSVQLKPEANSNPVLSVTLCEDVKRILRSPTLFKGNLEIFLLTALLGKHVPESAASPSHLGSFNTLEILEDPPPEILNSDTVGHRLWPS